VRALSKIKAGKHACASHFQMHGAHAEHARRM